MIEQYFVLVGLCMFIVSANVSFGIYPLVLRMARVWKFFDTPDARKLQREPVPVLGGLAVYYAIFISSLVLLFFFYNVKVIYMLAAMGLLLVVGMIDDKRLLSVGVRFLVETVAIVVIIILNGKLINTFGGLWGVGHLSTLAALPLSVFVGVGLVNSINLMDGVDGYSSSYVMLACCAFGIIFFISEIPAMGVLCFICAGSLLPFIMHNVFGAKTKMYIGDSGTLMMGMMLTVFCFSILKDGSHCYAVLQREKGVALIPLVLSILSICLFDTVRVMVVRMLHGRSPFRPDRGHLHHLFIDAGFSHIGATLSLLLLNALVVLGWLISWAAGADIEAQLYVVVGLSLLNTAGLHALMTRQAAAGGRLYRLFRAAGAKTHWEGSRFWEWMRTLVDDELFAAGKNP